MTRGSSSGPTPCCGDRRARHGGAASLLALVPLAFLAVFFVYPVAAIVGRGLAPDGDVDLDPLGDVVTDPALRHVVWFTVWQATLSTRPHRAGRAAGRVRARPLRVPRPPRRARPGDGARSCSRPWSWAPRSPACSAPAARSPGSVSTRRSWAILSRTCSSTTRSSCAPSAGLWSHLDPRQEEAARMLGASRVARVPGGHAARAAAGDRGRGGGRVPLHLHVVRRDPHPGRPAIRHARDRDLPPDRPAAEPRRSPPRSPSCSSSPSWCCSW